MVRRSLLILTVVLLAACGSPEQRAQDHYERGKNLLAQQDYARASVELRNAVRLKRDLVDAWRALATIDEHNQNWRALSSTLRTIIELDPADVPSRLKLGKFVFLSGSFDQALEIANAAARLSDRNADVLSFRAAVLLHLNDNAGAIRDATAALAIAPANLEANIVLAAERATRKDFQGALAILDRAPEGRADSLSLQLFKVTMLEQMGDRRQAEAVLRRLVDRGHPEATLLRKQLVRHYLNERRADDAERELRAIAAAQPTDVSAGMDVVRFLQVVRGPAAAEKELNARINTGGEILSYQIALAELYAVSGKPAEGIRLLERVIAAGKSKDDVLAAQAKLAELHVARRNFDAAEPVIKVILEKDRRNMTGLKLRAMLHMEAGRLDTAVSDLRQALNDQPQSAELMSLLALAYERTGAIELADRHFAGAMRMANFEPSAGLEYVSFLRRRSSIVQAEDVLTELANRRPGELRVLSALADVRLERQNWSGAQQIAELIRKATDNEGGIADRILGASQLGQGKLAEGVGSIEKAYYASVPGAAEPMAALVNTYMRAGQPAKALAFLETAVEANPDNVQARILLASVHAAQNKHDQAVKSLKTVIEQRPQSPLGYRALADLYLRQRNLEQARLTAQAGLKEQPNDFSLRLSLASVFELSRDYEAAISAYEALLKIQPGSMVVVNNLASLLAEHRTDKESLDQAHGLAASLRKTEAPHFKDTLGWVLYRKGDFKAAIPLLEEAANELPSEPLVRYHLGMAYVASGLGSRASQQLSQALKLVNDDEDLAKKIRAALEKAGS